MSIPDLELATKLKELGDDTLINVSALAALLCLTPASARQAAYRNSDFPPRFPTPSRHLRWRLGDVREWIRRRSMLPTNCNVPQPQIPEPDDSPTPEKAKGTGGRSRKAEQVRLHKLGERLKREQSQAGGPTK